jgi:hypothetical protein
LEELVIEVDYPVVEANYLVSDFDWTWDNIDSSTLYPDDIPIQKTDEESYIPTPTPLPILEDHASTPLESDTTKRTYHDRKNITPSNSPTRKKPRHRESSIRQALESKEPPHGLLLYFHKATESEHEKWVAQSSIDVAERADNIHWKQERRIQVMVEERRQRATDRKRAQRTRDKKSEIARGLRSPGGSRMKVSINLIGQKTHTDVGC